MQYATYRIIHARKEIFSAHLVAHVESPHSGSLMCLLENGFVYGESVCINVVEQPLKLSMCADGHDLTLLESCHDNGCEMRLRRARQ